MTSSNNFNTNEILLYNILHSTNNYINSSNNTIDYLNNSINHLNTNANNSLLLLLNNYNCYNNYLNANNANNANSNSPNAYLLNYTLEDFENLSNVNMRALVKINTAKINYCCIAVPLNDTCPITQEEFTNNDQVTIIKNYFYIVMSLDFIWLYILKLY